MPCFRSELLRNRGDCPRPCLGRGRLIESGSPLPGLPAAAPSGRRWQAIRERVFARYGRVCVHCGAIATDVDHVVPITVGGGDSSATCGPPAPVATAPGARSPYSSSPAASRASSRPRK
jgi:hypothetical protein